MININITLDAENFEKLEQARSKSGFTDPKLFISEGLTLYLHALEAAYDQNEIAVVDPKSGVYTAIQTPGLDHAADLGRRVLLKQPMPETRPKTVVKHDGNIAYIERVSVDKNSGIDKN